MILIVDDRPENIISLKGTLEAHGFRIDSASSGEEALKKILQTQYSLIILDVQMPVMDGFEVAESISGYSMSKDIPIIFLSAVNTEKEFVTRGYASGAVDYVVKPVDPDILLLKVKTFYKLSEQKRELIKAQDSLQKEIVARKTAQEKLNANMQELQSVLESLPQIAFTVTSAGDIEYVNEKWYQYSLTSSKLPEMHPDDTYVCDEWEEALKKKQEYISEVRIKKLGTEEFRHFLLKVTPVAENEKVVKWVGTFSDIHQQKEANAVLEEKVKERTQELIGKNEELESRNHELQQFAWVASHDLKEPLRKIQTFNHLVRDKYLYNNEEALKYLDRSIRSSQRMSELIENLLEYSRLSVASLFQASDMQEILKEIISDLEVSIQEKGAVIHIEKLPLLEVVPGQIRQVFQNLISNSLKFSRQDASPVMRIKAELVGSRDFSAPAVPDGIYCRIVVSDNGIGFDEKYRDKIFTIFQRLHKRDQYEGTGIGLAITRKIIEKHNGIITASGKVNEGAVFTIVLPVKQTKA